LAILLCPTLAAAAPGTLKVRVKSATVEMALEPYVAAVLAGECSTFRSDDGIKAMAVAARSYALNLRGRHAAEGYDLCATTHCQRLDPAAVTPRLASLAAQTAGEVLWFEGKPAFACYSRSCGGTTEDARAVWPDLRAPFLRSHADPYCARQGAGEWHWSARAAEIAAGLGTEVAALLAATLARLCQGQVAEVRSAFEIERDEDDYLRCISDKTAALMSTACRIGALTAGLNRSEIDDLSAFGEAFGMVFQIRDDVLDVVATEAELGKPPGQDLAEGIYTLPVQRALLDRVVGPKLRDLLGHPLDETEREEARALVASSPGISAAHEIARGYARAAAAAATRLGEGLIPKALVEFSYNVVDDLQGSAVRVLAPS